MRLTTSSSEVHYEILTREPGRSCNTLGIQPFGAACTGEPAASNVVAQEHEGTPDRRCAERAIQGCAMAVARGVWRLSLPVRCS